MKNYIIQDIETGFYYGGDNYGWCDRMRMAETFKLKKMLKDLQEVKMMDGIK